jgi:hypothetical protein
MRQGKLSELIHNSAGFQDLDTCSVEVWFREIIDMVSGLFGAGWEKKAPRGGRAGCNRWKLMKGISIAGR